MQSHVSFHSLCIGSSMAFLLNLSCFSTWKQSKVSCPDARRTKQEKDRNQHMNTIRSFQLCTWSDCWYTSFGNLAIIHHNFLLRLLVIKPFQDIHCQDSTFMIILMGLKSSSIAPFNCQTPPDFYYQASIAMTTLVYWIALWLVCHLNIAKSFLWSHHLEEENKNIG